MAPLGVIRMMVAVVIEAGFIASLKLTLRLVLGDTPVEFADGVKAVIIGAVSEAAVVKVNEGFPPNDVPAKS